MKTKLLLIAVAFSVLLLKVNAQSFLLQTFSGTPLNYGDTLIVTGTTNDPLMSPLAVVNNTAVTKNVMVERTFLSMVAGADNAFAWGMLMYPPSVSISVDPAIINAGATDSSFQTWYFCNGVAGVSYIKYRFYDENNPADSAWVVFQFNVTQAVGLNDFYVDNNLSVFPNASTGVFNITSNETFSKATAEIYNSNGNLILIKSISNQSKYFIIDLSNQPNGIYTLRLKDEKNHYVKTSRLVKI